jgi:anti-sigma factor RsiW
VHDLAAAYVLDALDDEERAAFEAHLEGCAGCRVEVDTLRVPAADLALAVAPASPPTALRGAILEAARAERGNVVPLQPRRSRVVPAAGVAFAVAAAAAVVLAIWVSSLRHSLDRERAAVSVLSDPASRRVPLRGAQGSLVVSPSGRAALVVRLPKPPAGRRYEAWVMDPQPHRAGLFSGKAIQLERTVHAGDTVAVTLERSDGVDAPTSKPLLTAAA